MTAVTLPLDIRASALARRSAKTVPWSLTFVRLIGKEDLGALHTRTIPDPKAPLARIRKPHHMLAQMVAEGKHDVEISRVCGYTPARINTLRDDPAFKELVHFYAEQEVFADSNVKAQVEHVALTALAELQERLDTEPEQFTIRELRELSETTLDRSGHGKTSTVTHNINNPAAVIEALRESLALERGGQILPRAVIDAEYKQIEATDAESPSPTGPLESGEDD